MRDFDVLTVILLKFVLSTGMLEVSNGKQVTDGSKNGIALRFRHSSPKRAGSEFLTMKLETQCFSETSLSIYS